MPPKIKIYRAAYVHAEEDAAKINFSGWVVEDGMDEVIAELMAVNPPRNGSPGGVPPIIIGWEEKELDTNPV